MTPNVCWVGSPVMSSAYCMNLKLGMGIDTTLFQNGEKGLRGVTEEEHSLIIYEAMTPIGDLEIPEEVADTVFVQDPHTTDCYVVQQMRTNRPGTPIMLFHGNYFGGTEPSAALQNLQQAGVTDFYNYLDTRRGEAFFKRFNELVARLRNQD